MDLKTWHRQRMNEWERYRRYKSNQFEDAGKRKDRGRDNWTKYPKSTAQFLSIGGFLVWSEPSTSIGQSGSNSNQTTKNTSEPTCSLKQDTDP